MSVVHLDFQIKSGFKVQDKIKCVDFYSVKYYLQVIVETDARPLFGGCSAKILRDSVDPTDKSICDNFWRLRTDQNPITLVVTVKLYFVSIV